MSAPTLDRLLARARQVEVRAEERDQRVDEVLRWARVEAPAPRRSWLVPGILGFALVAAVLALVWQTRTPDHAVVAGAPPPLWLGERVAVIAEPGASYRVAGSDGGQTTVAVERGAVTARLLPGAAPHRLVLTGGGVRATASGTVYTLVVSGDDAQVIVHEGKVDVESSDGARQVPAGAQWSRRRGGDVPTVGTGGIGDGAAARLLALVAPPAPSMPVTPVEPPAPVTPPAPPADGPEPPARPSRAPVADASTEPAAAPDLGERWRRARQLRGQGNPADALTLLLQISGADDETWSPLAHIEAIRVELEDRAAPERALRLTDEMLRRWPHHTLAGEVKTLRCRALTQLGRADDCRDLSPARAPAAAPAGGDR